MNRFRAFLGWIGCVLALFCAAAPASAQYTEDERFLAGLRARRLFDLAEEVCRRRLTASNLTSRQRVVLTVERMLNLTEKGVNATLAERPKAFEAAREIAREYLQNYRDESYGVLVRFQDALTVLTAGELQRLEAELGASSPQEIEAARTTLREAVNLLEAFDRDLEKLLPEARQAPKGSKSITVEELTAMRTHVGYQLARAARNQALLYPEKGEDRTASLLRGKKQLEDAVAASGKEDPLAWLAQTELAIFERLLGDLPRASQLLQDLEEDGAPASALPALRAEQVRLLVAQGRAGEAVKRGREWSDEISPRDADLDLAVLEAIVADELESKSTDALSERLRELEQRHGPYWGRRGAALVLKKAPAEMANESFDLLARTADQLFLQRNFDEAIATYDRAVQKASELNRSAEAFDLAMKAALVEQERGGFAEAVRRFVALSASPDAKEKAAEVHLLAAWNQAQIVRTSPNDAAAVQRYEELLNEQIERFAAAPSASTARLWMARLYASRGQLDKAEEVARRIPYNAKERDEALQICLRYWNSRSSEFDDPASEIFSHALAWARDAAGELQSPAERKVRAAAVGWELLHRASADAATAEKRLRELLQKTPASEAETIHDAQALLVVALAAQPGKLEEATKLLSESGGSAQQQLTSLLALVRLMKRATGDLKPALGGLVLEAIKKMGPALRDLRPAEKVHVDLAFVEATAAKQGAAEGEKAFVALVKKHANSAVVQEAYAQFLTDGAKGEQGGTWKTRALDQWRILGSRSPPRSERWYRAKYYTALLQFEMGQKEEAAKLIDYLDATPPGLSGAPMEAEFRALREKCGK